MPATLLWGSQSWLQPLFKRLTLAELSVPVGATHSFQSLRRLKAGGSQDWPHHMITKEHHA